MTIEIVGQVSETEWRRFLEEASDATLYHTPEWKRFLEATFGYEPQYLFSIDEVGRITGFLPQFNVNSFLTGNRLCSVPFSHCCGPIGDAESVRMILDNALNSFDQTNRKYFEIRSPVEHSSFKVSSTFSTYLLDLSPGPDKIWTNLESNVRRGIRKSQKMGVHIRKTEDVEDLRSFYELNCITKERIGVPSHPWKFFSNLFKYLKDYEHLYIARYNGEVIGGGIRGYYRSSVLAEYAASNPKYAKYYPFNALNWVSILDACGQGYKSYDLGRVSHDDQGLIFFKKRWGTAEQKMTYSYYPQNPLSLSNNRSSLRFKMSTKVIQKMPLPLYKMFSDHSFKHFG